MKTRIIGSHHRQTSVCQQAAQSIVEKIHKQYPRRSDHFTVFHGMGAIQALELAADMLAQKRGLNLMNPDDYDKIVESIGIVNGSTAGAPDPAEKRFIAVIFDAFDRNADLAAATKRPGEVNYPAVTGKNYQSPLTVIAATKRYDQRGTTACPEGMFALDLAAITAQVIRELPEQ